MKRALICFLALTCMLVCFFACSGGEGDKQIEDLEQLVRGFTQEYQLTAGTVYEKNTNPLDELLVFDLYYKDGQALELSLAEEYVLYLDDSSYEGDTEIGVFRLTAGADRDAFLSYLRARRDSLLAVNERYPFDTTALEQARFGVEGQYVYYIILRDHSAEAENTIKAALK